MVPPVTDTSDSEARSLLAEYFGEYINPDSTEYIPRISSHLEGITIERQDGELVRNIKKLFEPSSLNTTFQLVRFSVYLSSNNLLSNHQTDKLLQWMIRNGTCWVLERLFEMKTPTTEIFASNVLLSAARIEDIDTVRTLIAKQVEINAPAGLTNRRTALQEAVKTRNVRLVQLLLGAGADANARPGDMYENTALQEAIVGANNLELVQILLDAGADPNVPPNKRFTTTLLQRAALNNDSALARILLDAEAAVNVISEDCGTALQTAAQSYNIELVQMLLDAGADVDAPAGKLYLTALDAAAESDKTEPFWTSIQHAAENDNVELVQILLEAGADVNSRPTNGHESHLRELAEVGWSNPIRTALQAAVANENVVLVRLLLRADADVNARVCGDTALQIAAQADNVKLVQILLKKEQTSMLQLMISGGEQQFKQQQKEATLSWFEF